MNGAAPFPLAERHRYGFTARHVRCDGCQRDYSPQHVHKHGRCPGWWVCNNCRAGGAGWGQRRRFAKYDAPAGVAMDPRARTAHRYHRTDHEDLRRLYPARVPTEAFLLGYDQRRRYRRMTFRQVIAAARAELIGRSL